MGGDTLLTILQNLIEWITGPVGKTATIAVIIGAGFATWFKMLTMGRAIGIIGGTALIFGAGYYGQTWFGV